MTFKILHGDNRDTLKTLPDNSIDAIVTDPPYGIDFLGKDWDATTGSIETYRECLRVLKPGGHILAFSAARTYHYLAMTLEQAGFEIRDQIMWIYSSGFPKSQDVGRSIQRSLGVKEKKPHKSNAPRVGGEGVLIKTSKNDGQVVVTDPEAKQWEGWGTSLKPAHEPIALARKPMKDSTAKNCQTWGTGALNIDATRVPWGEDDDPEAYIKWMKKYPASTGSKAVFSNAHADAKGEEYVRDKHAEINTNRNVDNRLAGRFPSNVIGEILEPYQKYFYCPKVSRSERHIGFDDPAPNHWDMVNAMDGYYVDGNGKRDTEREFGGKNIYLPHKGIIFGHGLKHEYAEWCKANKLTPKVGNNHPTVKPIALMEYLIKLITPPGGTVLDPFNGSGSTGMAAVGLGFDYIGCELDPKYVEISQKRIQAWLDSKSDPITDSGLFDIE